MAPPAGDVSRELQESIRRALGRPRIHLLLRARLETKPRRLEERILVLTAWRLHLFSPTTPAKAEGSLSVLEIRCISATSPTQSSEVQAQVLHAVRRSPALEELILDNVGLNTDFASRLAAALAAHPDPPLRCLELPRGPLGDKGDLHISTAPQNSYCTSAPPVALQAHLYHLKNLLRTCQFLH
uniref:CARMIL pleckstrin homology domain-containing protein n=1 Tax=Gallus gallus TaxID=9031 RepID=A0A8V0XW98_CHICK